MAAILPMLLGPVTGIIGDVLKRVLPAEKMSEEDRAKLEQQLTLELLKADWTRVEAEFKDRESARQLAAADVAKGNWFSNVLAATVRPVWGYGCFALITYITIAPSFGFTRLEVPDQIWSFVSTVVAFLFGGRTVEKGIAAWRQK